MTLKRLLSPITLIVAITTATLWYRRLLVAPDTAVDFARRTITLYPDSGSHIVAYVVMAIMATPFLSRCIGYLRLRKTRNLPDSPLRSPIYYIGWLFMACVAAVSIGFMSEMLSSEITLRGDAMVYAAYGQQAEIRWDDVNAMVLAVNRHEQSVTISLSDNQAIKIDLIPFSISNAHMLLQQLADRAHLAPSGETKPGLRRWRRIAQPSIPLE